MNRITVSLAQVSLLPSEKEMIDKGHELAKEAKRRGSDLILFPEMWTTGFAWSKLKKSKHSFDELAKIAKTHKIWIGGSTPGEKELTNTFTLFSPEGHLEASYSKVHLFTLMKEDKHLIPGSHLTLYDAPWGKTGLAICYDIRFPEMFRTYALQGARLTLMPIAFPHPRRDHWMTMQRARAIENQMFMIMTNRVGKEILEDSPPVTYFGSSSIIDPWGKTVLLGSEDCEMLLTATLDLSEADRVRKTMSVLQDRRPDLYF